MTTVRRRTLTKGVAWAGPTIALGAAVPAIAGSCAAATCPSTTSAPSLSTWATNIVNGSFVDGGTNTATSTPVAYTSSWTPSTLANCTGGACSAGPVTSLSNAIVSQADVTGPVPSQNGGQITQASVTASTSVCLSAGKAYKVKFTWASWGCGHRNASLNVTLGSKVLYGATDSPPSAGTALDDRDLGSAGNNCTGGNNAAPCGTKVTSNNNTCGCYGTSATSRSFSGQNAGVAGTTTPLAFTPTTTGIYTLTFSFLYGTNNACFAWSGSTAPNSCQYNSCAGRTSQIGFSSVSLVC